MVTLNDSVGARAKRTQMWAWFSAGLALASVGLSVYGFVEASSLKDDYPSTLDDLDRYQSLKSSYDTASVYAYSGLAGALVMTGASLGLFVYSANQKSSSSRVSLTPMVGGALATFQWSW